MASVNNSDFFLVNRNDVSYKVQSENLMAYLEDTDYMLINRSDVTLKISGADVRASLATGSPLSPAVPPFGGFATTETVLNSTDGKVEFSLDGTTYSTNLTVPLNSFYYVDWGTDILSAAHGSPYSAQITATYSDLGTGSTIDFDINAIDKVPDPFSFTARTEVELGFQQTSEIISPLDTINAPTSIWVTSDAPTFQLRVGDSTWFDPPALPGSAYVTHGQEVQVRHMTGEDSLTTYTTTVHIGYGTGVGEFESADFATTTTTSFPMMRVLIDMKGGAGRGGNANGGLAGGGAGGEGQFALVFNNPTNNMAADLTGSIEYIVGQSNNSSGESQGYGNGGSNNGWNASGGGGTAVKLNGTVIAVCGGGGGGGGGYVNQNYGYAAGGGGLSPDSTAFPGRGGTAYIGNRTHSKGRGGDGGGTLAPVTGESAYRGLVSGSSTSAGGAGGGGCGTYGGGRGGYVVSVNEFPDESDADRAWGGGGGGGGMIGLNGYVIGDYTIQNISGTHGADGQRNFTQPPGYVKLVLQTKMSHEDDTAWTNVGTQFVAGESNNDYASGTKVISQI